MSTKIIQLKKPEASIGTYNQKHRLIPEMLFLTHFRAHLPLRLWQFVLGRVGIGIDMNENIMRWD